MASKTAADNKILDIVVVFFEYRYSVDNFSYSGPSGIMGSDGKQNNA